MNRSKLIVIVVVAVMFLVGARVDAALSLEARAAIEEIRARVNESEQAIVQTRLDDSQYVPGRELNAVLCKYRARIYGNSDATANELAHWRVSVQKPATVDAATYQPGTMLAQALNNYRAQRKVFDLVKVMKAREIDDREIEEPKKSTGVYPLEEDPLTLSEKVSIKSASSSELMTQADVALKASLKEKLQTSSQSSVSGRMASSSSDSADAVIESSSPDVADVSTEVQKYEFKMPRNYRIIVK